MARHALSQNVFVFRRKNAMNPRFAGALVSTVLVAALLLAFPAAADQPQPATLTASGDGSVQVVPDIAVVTIGVASRARTAGAALAQNSTDLTKAIAAIKAAGVDDKDIATSGFGIDPVYAEPKAGEVSQAPAIVGYSVSNSVTVTIREIGKSGSILDQVVAAGANQVTGISFSIADAKAANDAALKSAIAEALAKGNLMAGAAGVKLVRVLSVSTADGAPPRPVFAAMAMKADRAVPVMPGQQAITANATITWEIAPQ
jgi:uncharacterized protein YggE